MKALIFNSGLGSRLGKLTAHNPKCLVRLGNGETILHRQLRVLSSCGLRDFVITTGPYPDLVEAEARPFEAQGCSFEFVRNDDYQRTNYIWSLWLARDVLLDDTILLLHGDLVFDAAYVRELLALPEGSYGSVNPSLPLPEKDFKARLCQGEVREVGVETWGSDCVAFQALYRLTPDAMRTWLNAVASFVERGETGVYAENAANTVFEHMGVLGHSYEEHVVEEIDTPEDLARVSQLIELCDYRHQPVVVTRGTNLELVDGTASDALKEAQNPTEILRALGATHPLVVADEFFAHGLAQQLLAGLNGPDVPFELFCGYTPNPTYEQVFEGVQRFRSSGCDSLISLGGGSAIDVAKCIKLFAPLADDNQPTRLCDRPFSFSPIAHLAIPTTAGTGSESTHFAVLYVDGVKRSIAHPCLHPDATLLDSSLLAGLPAYQKKATLLDALAQAIESYWSRRSCAESRSYSRKAIPSLVSHAEAYLAGDAGAAAEAMRAANLAGKAINLTTTTAAHAMSYKLTSLYGIAHGHAVALCLPFTWRVLIERGDATTQLRLKELAQLMCDNDGATAEEGLSCFERLCDALGIEPTIRGDHGDLDTLVESVNVERLGNYPVSIDGDELRRAYANILSAPVQ